MGDCFCAVVSVDRTGKREIPFDADTTHIDWYHTDEDKDLFKELVGKFKLMMGHHLDDELKDLVGWYDCKIVIKCENFEWDWGQDYSDAWWKFWVMCRDLAEEKNISGVTARCGENEGDLESEEFGEETHYENCHTSQDVYTPYVTNKRITE